MSNLTPNEKTADAPIAEAVNEQLAPRKKGFYTWKAVLVPTLGLHWLLMAGFFLICFLIYTLAEFFLKVFDIIFQKNIDVNDTILDVLLIPLSFILCLALIIWVGIRFGRNLALKTKVPVSWAKRWLPLIACPLFTLIMAVCMVLSNGEGFWGEYCGQTYVMMNVIYAYFIILFALLANDLWVIFLANLVCFLPCILSFAFYQRNLKDLKPMPQSVKIILLALVLFGLAVVGYGGIWCQ